MARPEVTGRKLTNLNAADDADAYSVEEFCARHRISPQLFYKLKPKGLTAAGESTKAIAAGLDASAKTVETYRARAMQKLGLQSRADLVRYAVQQGWLQDG